MKRKIYKGGKDNYPLWWYGSSNRLQNFGDRPNFLTPNGPVFQRDGYYFDGSDDYMEDIYGRHLLREGTRGVWSQLYLTDSTPPPCGSAVGTGDRLYLSYNQEPMITGTIVLLPEFCPNLTYIKAINDQISVLDVSRLISLTALYCYGNKLSTLDVSSLISLTSFDCSYNQLSTLDISQLTPLTFLKNAYNSVTVLDVSNNSKLLTLKCYHNSMSSSAVDRVLCDANAWNTSDGTLNISSNSPPSQTGIDCKNEMVNRNWTVTTD